MFTRIQLKNFKSWQELHIDLAPITVLFGTNSSGKSSVIQSILLLWQSEEKHDLNEIDFGGGRGDYVDLGGYRESVYLHDIKRDIEIILRDTFYSEPTDIGLRLIYEDEQTYNEFIDPHDEESGYDIGLISDRIQTLIINEYQLHYLAPIRQYPKRSYLWSGARPRRIEPDGENTIAALIAAARDPESDLPQQVSEWLVKMELVDKFEVAEIGNDGRFYEPQVTMGGAINSLLDVGFGVSQVLPVITTLFYAPEGSIVMLEQPELHLHPRAQSHLADLLLHVAEERNLQLIVESHSEHVLRRFQRRIAEESHDFANPDNIKMYFCDKGNNGSTIQEVTVDQYGQISNYPKNFFGDITGDLEAMTMAALQRSMNGKQD